MATAGTVLFQRGANGTDSDTDLWDDTALIKAYDQAVNKAKAQMKKQSGNEASDGEQKTGEKKINNKNRKKKRKNRQKKAWKVGDVCRAKFSEDNLFYEAQIMSLDEESGTCLVQYTDYGNEEEQNLNSLLRFNQRRTRQDSDVPLSEKESTSVADSMDWCNQGSHGTHGSKKSRDLPKNHMPQFSWPGSMGNHNFPFQPMPLPSFPFMSSMPSFSQNPFQMPSNLPFMPPPPPPVLDEEMEDSNNEALCSMLMAWYMSGYHTGYYQGLKQSQQQMRGGVSPRPDSFR